MKQLINKLRSYLPEPLPVGLAEFHKYADSIIELSGKFADEDSLKFAICSMIMHAGEAKGYLPKQYFVKRLRKVAANQVAGQVFTDIKEKQKVALEETKRAEAAKLVEDTTNTIESSDVKT